GIGLLLKSSQLRNRAMHRISLAFAVCGFLFVSPYLGGKQAEPDAEKGPARERETNPARGQTVAGADKTSVAAPQRKARVRLMGTGAPASARVSIVASDGKSLAPAGAPIRNTKRGEAYFYAHEVFDVDLPTGRARMNFSGGLETIPQTVTLDTNTATELTVP